MATECFRGGRGGAGNIFPVDELRKKEEELAKDARDSQSPDAPAEAAPEPGEEPEYKHMGRGGFANWYKPGDVATTAATEASGSQDTAHASTPEPPPEHAHSLRPWQGRGGAGNYAWEQPESESRVEEEEKARARKLELDVLRCVNGGLAKPGPAHVHPRGDAEH